ncbi:hypothetical protein LG299_12605 [Microbacterium lacus]|uniref:hypothetical protein n=1 Tax=Microbacterium lacus TaxID=415217 RepID=UPI00384E5BC0
MSEIENQVRARGGGTRHRFRAAVQKAAATLAVLAFAVAAMVVATAPAHAAPAGLGYGNPADDALGWVGSYNVGSQYAWCVEPGIEAPLASTDGGTLVASFVSRSELAGDRVLTADDLARINAVTSTFGPTQTAVEHAALYFVVQAIANPGGLQADVEARGYSGAFDLSAFANWRLFSMPGAGPAAAAEVGQRAEEIYAWAMTQSAGPSVVPAGQLVFDVTGEDHSSGTVTAVANTVSTGTITLTGAIFTATGTSTLAGAALDTPYAITAIAPEDGPMHVSGEALFGSTAGGGWMASVYAYASNGQQIVAAGAGVATSAFTMTGEDPFQREPFFEPVVATSASTYVRPGEPFVDAVSFGVAEGSDAWVQSSNGYRQITAQGMVYGPFATHPAESDAVPADAPIAGTATVTSSLTNPAEAVTATSDQVASASGFYTWVWTINAADQGPITQLYLPDGYAYQDRFGQVVETSLVGPTVTTQAQPGAKPGASISDTAIVEGSLPTGGAELSFDAYRVPVVQDAAIGAWVTATPEGTEPGDLSWVCTDANRVWSSESQLITTAGEYSSGPSTPVEAGTHLWVERLVTLDGHVLAEGICGIPNETTFVLDVTTVAQSRDLTSATPTLWDTARITGAVPEGATVVFEAFRGESVEAACATTPIFTSEPVVLTAGFYDSVAPLEVASSTFQAAPLDSGTVVTWVETTRDADGRIISKGACGEPSETVLVARTAAVVAVVATGGFNMAPIVIAAGGIAGLSVIALAVMLLARRRAAVREEVAVTSE